MISISQVSVIFNAGTVLENHALQNINVHIPEGEFVTVIGSNGAGKSTLLNLLSGEVLASSGIIEIDNVEVTKAKVHERAHLVARVFQDPQVGTCAGLTIAQNMAIAMRRGKSRGLVRAMDRHGREHIRQSLAVMGLGLENRLDDLVEMLSGGQRQALSLIMATLSDSKILLLDEHTAALDPHMAGFVLELTDRLYEHYGTTIMMVTHSMRQALAHGQRTIMLHQGRIILDVGREERSDLTVDTLLEKFSQVGETQLDDIANASIV